MGKGPEAKRGRVRVSEAKWRRWHKAEVRREAAAAAAVAVAVAVCRVVRGRGRLGCGWRRGRLLL